MYSPPENVTTDPLLNGYCVETSCYSNVVDNNMFTSDQCNSSFCKVAKTLVPTLPDIDNGHWFFDYFLYIGGVIHLLMSITIVISYFLINKPNFALPDFVLQYVSKVSNSSDKSRVREKEIIEKAKHIPVLGALLTRPSTYSDEPLFGIRSLYHIVSTCTLCPVLLAS